VHGCERLSHKGNTGGGLDHAARGTKADDGRSIVLTALNLRGEKAQLAPELPGALVPIAEVTDESCVEEHNGFCSHGTVFGTTKRHYIHASFPRQLRRGGSCVHIDAVTPTTSTLPQLYGHGIMCGVQQQLA
jgi:hypothetical protein